MIRTYQIGRSPFNPLTSFLAYATGDEEITLKENSVAKIIRTKDTPMTNAAKAGGSE